MKRVFLAACLLGASSSAAWAKAQYARPIPAGAQAAFVVDAGPPDPKYVGPGMAQVPDTSFMILQAKGGSIRETKLGSLNFFCNKVGGMGIYSFAKEFFSANARLIEERDGNIVVRLRSNENLMLFGLHTMARSQVHRLD